MTDKHATDFASAASNEAGGNILGEFWYFLRNNKKWWLLPIVIILLLFGALMLLTGTAARAVHLYAVLTSADVRCSDRFPCRAHFVASKMRRDEYPGH